MPFGKLLTPATSGEKGGLYFSWGAALLTGLGLPMFILFISRIFNSFGPDVTPEETLKTVTVMYGIMVGLGAFTGLMGFTYWYISLKFADMIARRTKENFLEAALQQETAWYDANNSNELAARMTKESMVINKAVAEKPGLILVSLGMSGAGLIIGFT